MVYHLIFGRVSFTEKTDIVLNVKAADNAFHFD